MSVRDTLAGEFERGTPWNPRKNPDDPNPLYAEAIAWSKGKTAHGDADFLNVRDDDGTLWSILVGCYDLRRDLLEGEITEWDDEALAFVILDVRGPVVAGELLAVEFKGERQYINKEGRTVTAPKYHTLRRNAAAGTDDKPAAPDAANEPDDDIPF